MGITGTSVSKESADIVLADDNFASIAAAVEEGRRVYDNLVKSLAFVLPTNLALGLILMAAVMVFPMHEAGGVMVPLLPMLPVQLLWINLFASVALSLPLAFEVKEPGIMDRPPRSPDEPVMNRFVIYRTVLAAVIMAAAGTGLFLFEYYSELARVGHELALRESQTMAVTTVVSLQIFYLLNCRSIRDSVFKIGLFSNKTVFAGIAVLVALQGALVYWAPLQAVFGTAALSGGDLLFSMAVGTTILPVISIEKALRAKKRAVPPAFS
jgi:magnesium-transporting ATPase (P-type)